MEWLRMYGKLLRISMLGRMQYKSDFFTGIFGVLILNAVNLAMLGTIVYRFHDLGGWGLWELVLLYSLWMLSHSLYSLLFWHFMAIEDMIVSGGFDRFLLRPLPVLLQFLAQGVQYMGVGDVIVGVSGLTLAYVNLGLHWSPGQWLLLLLCIPAGAVVETSVIWILATVAFWTTRSRMLTGVATSFNTLVQQYPTDIFGTWFRMVVTGLLPFAFMNYYPALALLGKQVPGVSPWLSYLSPLVAVVFGGLAYGFWTIALRRYSSTGN